LPIKYDLLLKNGDVLDPAAKLRGRRDIAFRNGLVAAVAENIASGDARETIDVSGKLVTPGLRTRNTITGATGPSAICSRAGTRRFFVTATITSWNVRYIHLNPARLKTPEDLATYRWSSHHAYLGSKGVAVDATMVLE
jgi:hypothetical protein